MNHNDDYHHQHQHNDQDHQHVLDKLESLILDNVDPSPLPSPFPLSPTSLTNNNTANPQINYLGGSHEISMDGVDIVDDGTGKSGGGNNWFDNITQYRSICHDRLMSALHPQYDLAQYYDAESRVTNRVAPPHTIDQSALFASYALPNRHEMLNRSALPMGVLLSPFDRPVVIPKSSDFYPPNCAQCHAYINVYCKLDRKPTTSAALEGAPLWVCAVCRHENPIDSGTKGVRSVWEVKQGLGWWATDHYQTALQSDYYDVKKRKQFNSITTSVPSDPISTPQTHLHEAELNISERLKSSISMADSSSPSPPTTPLIAPTSPQSIAKHPNVYMFVVDENLPQEELEIIGRSAAQLLGRLPQESMVALISFSKIVSLYEMSSSSQFSAAKIVYGGQSISNSTSFSLKLKRKLFLESIHAGGMQKFQQNFQSLMETSAQFASSSVHSVSALGVAIEVALSLITTSTANSGRIFAFLHQAPNFGPGSIGFTGETSDSQTSEQLASEYYKLLGERAYRKSIAVDLHLVGFNDFSSRVLAPLAFPTGQLFISHDHLGESDRTDMLSQNMYNSIAKSSGIYSRLDIHYPEQINLTHVIGPTTKVNEQQTFINDVESGAGYSSASVELTNLQQDVALSLFFDLQEDIPQDYVYFQFVVHLLDQTENRILRVITKRVKITGNFNRFIDSLDLNVSAVLLSKKLILDSMKSSKSESDEYFDFKDKIDKQLKLISQKCANVEKGWFRNTVTIPEIIKQFIKKMYLIREGVLFGSIIQNKDDFEVLSSLFINTNFTDSMRIMLPKLIQSDQSDQLIEIPPKIDSLTDDKVLIYDAQTHIYLFIGSSVSRDSSAVMHIRSFIENQIIHRVPTPYILTFNENEHNIRWLKARLQYGNMETENYYQTIINK